GERAVSIKVNVAGMVAGFLAPGSYVDVVLTYQSRVNIDDEDPDVTAMVNMNLGRLAAETILQNVRVLAVDQRAERKDDDKIKVGKTVTLAVSARQAEKLALAAEMGDITLAMRGVGDDLSNKAEPAITDARMSSIDDEIYAEYLRMKQQTQIKSDGITVYSGSSVLSGSSK
ncbi:MAG: Flp pilus assembly protein CpaB, partial [Alphaproteobacteria bacterium]